ncbi:SRPBCC family protein [Nonomuraea sp. NPDC050790]|uniref:SRPBCC family protein n=1 Tax=Nonomuraea sp. NPDC050790 TaxID=3364371 RepID=UPI0037AEB351
MVYNVHERVVDGSPEEVWAQLTDVGRIYPETSGTFELPEGLFEGAPVRHDGQRYRVAVVEPGRRLWFDVGRTIGGGHGFELFPVAGGTLVRHTINGRLSGLFALLWPLVIRRAHDRALEGLLDNLEREVARAHAG